MREPLKVNKPSLCGLFCAYIFFYQLTRPDFLDLETNPGFPDGTKIIRPELERLRGFTVYLVGLPDKYLTTLLDLTVGRVATANKFLAGLDDAKVEG